MTDQKPPKKSRAAPAGLAPVKLTSDAAGTWVQIGDRETGAVYLGPFSDSDPRMLNLRDKVLCR